MDSLSVYGRCTAVHGGIAQCTAGVRQYTEVQHSVRQVYGSVRRDGTVRGLRERPRTPEVVAEGP